MARSACRLPILAILGVAGYAALARLAAFVGPWSSNGPPSQDMRSLVRLSASKQEIAEAEKHAKLLVWAAKTAAEQGAPQAATMQAKADQAVAALEALKQGGSSSAPVPVAPVASAPVSAPPAAVPMASSGPSKQEIAEAEKHAKLLVWAAKTAAEKGAPQAAMMKTKADQAVAALEALKQQAGSTPATVPIASAPVSAPPIAAAPAVPVASSGPSKQEIAEAEKHAKLMVWAAKTAAEKGAPQAAMMKTKADQAVAALEALKQQQVSGASAPAPVAAVASAPVSSPPVAAAAPAMPSSAPTKEELEQAKKEMDLLVWAAKTAAEKGAPQAAMMKAKADAKVQAYEAMKAMTGQKQMAFR